MGWALGRASRGLPSSSALPGPARPCVVLCGLALAFVVPGLLSRLLRAQGVGRGVEKGGTSFVYASHIERSKGNKNEQSRDVGLGRAAGRAGQDMAGPGRPFAGALTRAVAYHPAAVC